MNKTRWDWLIEKIVKRKTRERNHRLKIARFELKIARYEEYFQALNEMGILKIVPFYSLDKDPMRIRRVVPEEEIEDFIHWVNFEKTMKERMQRFDDEIQSVVESIKVEKNKTEI